MTTIYMVTYHMYLEADSLADALNKGEERAGENLDLIGVREVEE